MKSIKLNPTSISFIPIFIFIPVIFEIVKNFHIGGIYLFINFLFSAIQPEINNEITFRLVNRIFETLFIAFTSWSVSIIFGLILGILSSDIFYRILKINSFFKHLIRTILVIIRSLHELVWGIILMQIYGINFSIAIISISIPYIAINAKVITEQLSNIKEEIIVSIEQSNQKKFSSLLTLAWSPIIKTLSNFGIYRLECCLRSTAILGLFGLGGIGTSIYLSFQTLNFRELWTYLWALSFLILLVNKFTRKIKFEKLNPKISIFLVIIGILIFFYSLIYTLYFVSHISNQTQFLFDNFYFSKVNLSFREFKNLTFETILLSLSATAIALSMPPFLYIFFNHKYVKILIQCSTFFLRVVPTPIILLIFLMFNQPTLSIAALALGLHNAGILSKILSTNLNSTNPANYIAIKSIGSSNKVSLLLGIFSTQAKSYLAYAAYRSDILFRETIILGLVGSVGLGWQLQESLSSFAWNEVLIILLIYSSIAIIGELINGKITSTFSKI